MRITTSQVLRNYQTNLAKSNTELNNSWNKVLTQRNFSKASEDPSAASKAFKLRKQYLDNEDYIENTKTLSSTFQAVSSSTMEINSIVQEANSLVLQGISETVSASQRKTIATSLRGLQESVVLSANSKLGDTFIFGGQNTSEAPFKLSGGKLTYCGLDVSSSDPDVQNKLKEMSNQQIPVDLGFGLTYDSLGNLNNNSAYNTAFSGLNALGYGKNSKGVDTNIVNLLGNLADELEKPTIDHDKISQITDQFDTSKNNLLNFVTDVGTKSNFLDDNQKRLEDTQVNLSEGINSLEYVNLADAISNYTFAQFAYNAALKVGNNIIGQSFIDFMH